MKRCCVFNGKAEKDCLSYEVIKKYDWKDLALYTNSSRELVRCKNCNALFIHQISEIENMYVARFIEVETEEEADEINRQNDSFDFSNIEKPSICVYKDNCYFTNLDPKKELTREEQIEEIKKMTIEEKIKEWEELYRIYSDFDVFSYSTDSIDLVIMCIKDICLLAEETGGMDKEYKDKFEKLIKDYEEKYKECEIKEKQLLESMYIDLDELFSDLPSVKLDKKIKNKSEDENK